MPNEPSVWILLIVLAALVTGLALWLGRGFIIRKDEKGFSIEAKEKPAKPSGPGHISVGNKAEFQNVKAGDIGVIKSEDQGTEIESGKNIDVLKEGKITNAELGDIFVIKRQGKKPESKS